jgi:hypothetical protein
VIRLHARFGLCVLRSVSMEADYRVFRSLSTEVD